MHTQLDISLILMFIECNENLDGTTFKQVKQWFWPKMDWMDILVYFHNNVFSASEWNTFKFFPDFKGVETRGSSFPLFVLAMEVLNCLWERVSEGGYLLGFRVRGGGSLSSFVCR